MLKKFFLGLEKESKSRGQIAPPVSISSFRGFVAGHLSSIEGSHESNNPSTSPNWMMSKFSNTCSPVIATLLMRIPLRLLLSRSTQTILPSISRRKISA